MKQRDGENKVKVAEGDDGMVVVGSGMGGGCRPALEGRGRKASFDVEPVDPACCLGRTQVW